MSTELVNLTVTSYLIFQGLAPSLWGPLSDVHGRRVAYLCTFAVFLAACVGLAEARSYAALLVLRCLQSTGSASTIAIGSGVIGDVTTRAERGGLMGVFQAGLLVPVAVGPVVGGALAGASALGWRAIFWFLVAYSGAFLVVLTLLLPETLRSIVGNGSRTPGRWIARFPLGLYQRTTRTRQDGPGPEPAVQKKRAVDITGPLRILFSRHAAPIIVFLAVHYAVWQMSITAMSTLLAENYGLGETQIGLTFIANGVGSIIGTLMTGKLLDIDYRRVKARHDTEVDQATPSQSSSHPETSTTSSPGCEAPATAAAARVFPLEKARLRLLPVLSLLQCGSILVFGWTMAHPERVSLGVPVAFTFVTGFAAVAAQSAVSTYLVDVFASTTSGGGNAAAASASLNLARCLAAAGGTSFVMPLVRAVGAGWAFTVCVAAQVAALAGWAVQLRFAGRWRAEAEERQRKEDEEKERADSAQRV